MIIKDFLAKKSWCVEKTSEWLIELWRGENWENEDPDKLLQLFSSLIICYKFRQDEFLIQSIEDINGYINEYYEKKVLEANPFLITMTNFLLKDYKLFPNYALNYGELEVKKNIKDLPDELKNDPRIFFLMKKFDFVSDEQMCDFINKYLIFDSRFLLLDQEEIRKQLFLWFICTSMGRKDVPEYMKENTDRFKILLSGCMLAECQKYQLDLVSQIIRTMKYLNYEQELLQDGIDFLCFQQRTEGCFGYLNPFNKIEELTTQKITMNFYLPMTYEILWAFAEVFKESEK